MFRKCAQFNENERYTNKNCTFCLKKYTNFIFYRIKCFSVLNSYKCNKVVESRWKDKNIENNQTVQTNSDPIHF